MPQLSCGVAGSYAHCGCSLPLPPAFAEPCSASGGCLGQSNRASSNATERTLHSQQQVLDLSQIPGVMRAETGATLSLVNLLLANVAYKTSYVPTSAQPYRVEGVGTGLWPSIQMGPGSSVSGADCHPAGVSADTLALLVRSLRRQRRACGTGWGSVQVCGVPGSFRRQHGWASLVLVGLLVC